MQSFSEIDTTSKRASKAAGFAWGVAEEIGKNMKNLEMFGVRHGIQFMNDDGEKMMGYTSAGTLTPPGDDRPYGVSYSVSWLRPRGENFWDKDYRVLNASAGLGRLDIR